MHRVEVARVVSDGGILVEDPDILFGAQVAIWGVIPEGAKGLASREHRFQRGR